MAAKSFDTQSDSLARAQALVAQGKPREACALLKSNLEHGRGGLLSRIALERALRLEPALTRARFALGAAWLEAGEAKRAIELLAPLKSDDPSLADQVED